MKLLAAAALLLLTLSGCVIERSGSQAVEIGPGYMRPADEETNRVMWESTGDPSWRDGYYIAR